MGLSIPGKQSDPFIVPGMPSVFGDESARTRVTFETQNTQNITTSAVTIVTTGGAGKFVMVTGHISSGAAARFMDILLIGSDDDPVLIASRDTVDVPDARIYTREFAGTALELEMGGGTYDVTCFVITAIADPN